MSTYTLSLAEWLADPDYRALHQMQRRLDDLLRADPGPPATGTPDYWRGRERPVSACSHRRKARGSKPPPYIT